jgi:hypothetical protein
MKKILILLTILTLLTMLPAISGAVNGGLPTITKLIAGGGNPISAIEVGYLTAVNIDDTLSVTYETLGDWCITETHLQVAISLGGIPQTKTGNPIPGKFDYYDEHECVQMVTYVIRTGNNGCTERLIAAHAVVEKVEPDTIEPIVMEETAWAVGEDFPGKNWAEYFTRECEPACPCFSAEMIAYEIELCNNDLDDGLTPCDPLVTHPPDGAYHLTVDPVSGGWCSFLMCPHCHYCSVHGTDCSFPEEIFELTPEEEEACADMIMEYADD